MSLYTPSIWNSSEQTSCRFLTVRRPFVIGVFSQCLGFGGILSDVFLHGRKKKSRSCLSSLITEPRLKLSAVPLRSGEDLQQITGSRTNKSQSGDDGDTYRLVWMSEKQDVTSWCLNPVQILFGVRASWLLPEEQQAQTAKRPTRDKHFDLIVRLRMRHHLRGGIKKELWACEEFSQTGWKVHDKGWKQLFIKQMPNGWFCCLQSPLGPGSLKHEGWFILSQSLCWL